MADGGLTPKREVTFNPHPNHKIDLDDPALIPKREVTFGIEQKNNILDELHSPQKKSPEEEAEEELKKLMQEKIEAQNRLYRHQKEFEFVSRMGSKDLGRYLIGKTEEMNSAMAPMKPPPLPKDLYMIKHRDFEVRAPEMKDFLRRKEALKNDFYAEINRKRMKELLENHMKRRMEYKGKYVLEDLEKLDERYYYKYMDYLRKGPTNENERQARNKALEEIYEMMAVMKNMPSLDEPKIWHHGPMSMEESKDVIESYEKKVKSFDERLKDDPEIEGNEIMSKVRSRADARFEKIKELEMKVSKNPDLMSKSFVQSVTPPSESSVMH